MQDKEFFSKRHKSWVKKFKYTEVCIAVIMFCCMTMNYIINIIGSNMLYIIVMAIVLICFFGFRRNIYISLKYSVVTQWWVAAIVVVINTIRTSFDINTYVDAYVICVFLLIISFSEGSPLIFTRSIKLIYGFAMYYALSIWVQMLLPDIYEIFLRMLSASSRTSVINLQRNTGYSGFTTNPGFVAGYIVDGIILVMCGVLIKSDRPRYKHNSIFFFLLLSLFFTGKRGHLLAVVVAIIVMYVSASSGAKKLNRLSKVLLGIAVSIIALLFFGEVFSAIPALARIASTITGLISGTDVSNNRARLYEFAIRLFKENPMFGVGWGQYRVLTVGNVTLVETIEAHNIYLQMLCEMGVVGFVSMILPMGISLHIAIKNVKKMVTKERNIFWNVPVLFSLGYQVFFLVYGLTGNPLYDHNCLLMYLFAIMIAILYQKKKEY